MVRAPILQEDDQKDDQEDDDDRDVHRFSLDDDHDAGPEQNTSNSEGSGNKPLLLDGVDDCADKAQDCNDE